MDCGFLSFFLVLYTSGDADSLHLDKSHAICRPSCSHAHNVIESGYKKSMKR